MAREINKLSARSVATIKEPGRHSDGAGLYLVVDPGGARRWLFMFRWQGKLKEMGLGGVNAVSLVDARTAAAEARKLVQAGTNPIEHRRATGEAVPTFAAMAEVVVASVEHGLKNKKDISAWRMTLSIVRDKKTGALLETGYCLKLRNKLVSDIDTAAVLEVLQPIWATKPETASRLRGRIERVLDAAKAKGHRSSENPARWRGHLDNLLSRKKKQRAHHEAMPYADMPAFISELRERTAVSALMLEFTILCALRSSEVVRAKWSEVDRKAKIWTVPAVRMKGGLEHRVPLGPRALEILDTVEKLRGTGDWIFPGTKKGRPFSHVAMLDLLQVRMKKTCTVHGFRSSFRDWADEQTSFAHEVAEAALAHLVGNEVSRAYRRSDALEKRRKLMLAWEEFVTGNAAGDKVVPLHAG